MKSLGMLGELITTKVIRGSTAESMSKCEVTFRYLKKAHERNPTNRLRLYLGSITIIKIANHFISCLYNIYWDLSISILFFYPVYIYVYTCTYKNLWQTSQRITKEYIPGIIKEKEYRDIKMHAFQWESIKTIATSLYLS